MSHATQEVPFKGFITVSIMLATVMQVLDTTIANVALPHMQGSLSATQDQVAWILTSYIVASAIMTLPTAWLSGRFGQKKIFLFAITGFTISSVLCGLATSIEQMVAYRIIQGICGASIVPLAQATLLNINRKENHGKAMALWGMGVVLGPILGPTLGGWLTENYNWRWVFYINIPVGIIAFLGVALFMPDSERSDRPFDKLGFFFLAVFIGSAQMIMDRGEQQGWLESREILLYIAFVGSALWMYVIHSGRVKHPFLTPGIFRDRNLLTATVFIFFIGLILLATMTLLPPYMQTLMGYPVMDVGMLMAPRGMGTMFGMFIVGRYSNQIDPRIFISIGLLLTLISLYAMTGFTTYVPPFDIIWTGVLQGWGVGLIFVPLSTIAYSTLDPKHRAEAASIFSLSRNLGSSMGISLVVALLTRSIQRNHAYLSENITAGTIGINWLQVPNSIMENGAAALTALDMEITRQAMTIAYVNDFKIMMWVVVFVSPLVLLLKKGDIAPPTEPIVD
ncbi:MAG: DHA2 family efflux MFS transporter permease subunit [Pseudohongiellaceae bacterium]|nr:DHA2 family efflux MFS transporter permease subunit [Pseudohongiellaceae bacterium]